MKRYLWRMLDTLVRCMMIAALTLPLFPGGVAAQTPPDDIVINFTTFEVPVELWEPIEMAIQSNLDLLSETDSFTVSAFEVYEDWIHAIAVPTYVVEAGWEVDLTTIEIVEILGHQDEFGVWTASINEAPDFLDLAREVPSEFIDFSYLLSAPTESQPFSPTAPDASVTYLFPWKAGEKWYKNGGWHADNFGSDALDFTRGAAAEVIASARGRVTVLCPKWGTDPQTILQIDDGKGGKAIYTHLATSSIPKQIIGKEVVQGQYLGSLYKVLGKTRCGTIKGIHLHFDFPSKDMTIDGKKARDVAKSAGPYRSSNEKVNLTKCPSSNTSNEVILYGKESQKCSDYGGPDKLGYFKIPVDRSDVNLNGFNAASIAVPDGYEVILLQNNAPRQVYRTGNHSFSKTSLVAAQIVRCPARSSALSAIAYRDPQYSCGGLGNPREGYMYIAPDVGPVSIPSGFGISSLEIADGYHAEVYLRSHPHLPPLRLFRDQPDFSNIGIWDSNHKFISYNDNIGKIAMMKDVGGFCPLGNLSVAATTACIPNKAPNTPTLKSPNDGHTILDSKAPTLCWNNKGDPDGDAVEFKVEIYDGPKNANSGWVQGTCWRPSTLDKKYGTYRWRVKVRDIAGVESNWSSSRSFTIASPNKAPSINFQTANGDAFSSGTLYSREQNWIFRGTASDPEGHLNRIDWRCSGDDCGTEHSKSGTGSWTYERRGLSGRNEIYFRAYDDKGNYGNSRTLILLIDLAAPKTQVALNNNPNSDQWPTWFVKPVDVQLKAQDGATSKASAGVKELHYRVNGGAWQVQSGDTVKLNFAADGAHTVEYYAVDKVGNAETARSVTFQIDQTPPASPAGIVETHGVPHNTWQKNLNTPTFTWDAAVDATSGVWGYQFYFGDDPAGIGLQEFRADQPREWTPYPGGTPTGVYYLRGRARDNAGHWSAWTDLFTFRYDDTPPQNPISITHAAGITSTVWQRVTTAADFAWPVPYDQGSGIQGYHLYWGADPEGVTDNLITANVFQDATPLCAADAVCTGYLRLRSVDNVDIPATAWTTGFILRYDNVPPTVDFTFNNGMTMTDQVSVTLNVSAADLGSGVSAMRFSADGVTWTPWEVYTTTRGWNLPPISRKFWPVYAQVRDGVGLESAVISHTVYLEVNRLQPRSANFRLFDHTLSAGAGSYTSTLYTGRGTLGQLADTGVVTSGNFSLIGGYEAGSQALPLVIPTHDEYTFFNGIFASGTGAETLRSATYTAVGVFGELGLPNVTTLASGNFVHQPGFLAAAPIAHAVTPPTQTVGTTPITPTYPCDTPHIFVNDDAPFTNQLTVTLALCAPAATEMWVSNLITPTGVWEPYAMTKTWVLSDTDPQIEARYVYAGFRDAAGAVYATYFDDIRYDTGVPSFTLTVDAPIIMAEEPITWEEPITYSLAYEPYAVAEDLFWSALQTANVGASGAITLYLGGMDENSGIAEIQLSEDISFTNALWEPVTPLKTYTPLEEGITLLYARARDGAGNVSPASEIAFIYDISPPEGETVFEHYVLGPETITNTLYLDAWDSGVGIDGVRVSYLPDFSDAIWEPYTYTLTIPVSLTLQTTYTDGITIPVAIAAQDVYTLYIQYRDASGYLSDVYTDTFFVDSTPPVAYTTVAADVVLTNTTGVTLPAQAVTVYAYDDLSGVTTLYLSNDPWMEEGVYSYTYSYESPILWPFDDSRIAWLQVEDALGNLSEPYLVYATEAMLTVVGPDTGMIDATHTFTASINLTATTVLTYTWNTDSSAYTPTVVHGYTGIWDAADFIWALPGLKTLTVNASTESQMYTATHTIVITSTACPAPLMDVSIAGPVDITASLYIGDLYTFQAVITPTDATPPITYTWTPTPTNGQGPTASYQWDAPGNYPITLTVENCGGSFTVQRTVTIYRRGGHFIYLPLTLRNQ